MTTNGEAERVVLRNSRPRLETGTCECRREKVCGPVIFSSLNEEQTFAEMGREDCGLDATGENPLGERFPKGI
jgi:hypothetical protein